MNKLEKIILPTMNPEVAAKEIGCFVIEIIKNAESTGGVIGLSGGVDSTVTAALVKQAFDIYNKTHDDKLELFGYMLPSKINKPDDLVNAIYVAEKLGIDYKVINIEKKIESYNDLEDFNDNYLKGNLTSEIRANILHHEGRRLKKTVIGTGNKDEDYGVGYYTLFGDGAVHLNPIGALSKRLVRQMACYLGFDKIAGREPTAALEPNQTDFKDLGYDYDAVELIIEGKDQGFSKKQLIHHHQVNLLVKSQIKKYETSFGYRKFSTVEQVVDDILDKHIKNALLKSDIVHPYVPKIILRYDT